MRYNVSRTSSGVRAQLREELDISSVSEDRDHLVQLLSPDGRMELDLAGVTEIDAAGIQLLAALRKEAKDMGCACLLSGANEGVRGAFELLGLGHLLEESQVGKEALHGS